MLELQLQVSEMFVSSALSSQFCFLVVMGCVFPFWVEHDSMTQMEFSSTNRGRMQDRMLERSTYLNRRIVIQRQRGNLPVMTNHIHQERATTCV
jgi:hypothetical protein